MKKKGFHMYIISLYNRIKQETHKNPYNTPLHIKKTKKNTNSTQVWV
jgi:hypothetical protein